MDMIRQAVVDYIQEHMAWKNVRWGSD